MEIALRLALTLIIGAAGSYILYRLKVPAGAMVGSIIAVGAFQICSSYAFFPKVIKVAVQAVAGAFVGQRIGRRDIRELRSIIKPSIELFVGIVLLTLTTGLLIYSVADISIETAIISSMPGGVSDIALISGDIGADPAQSTVLQLVRYLIAILILPQVDIRLCRRFAPEKAASADTGALASSVKKKDARHIALTLAITAASGALGKLSGFPAGAIVFPMLAVAAYNVKTGEAYLPPPLKLCAQNLAGVNIGVTITLTQLLGFRELLVPALLVAVNCVAVNFALGLLIYKTNKLDLATCLFASVPAGLSDMALVSLEQGGNAPKVAVLQLVRYICVMTFIPSMIRVISQLVS